MTPLETYLRELRAIRSSGAAVDETSYYGPLADLLNEVGRTLKPRVRCILNIQNSGAGMPDGGLFTADQFQRPSAAEPPAGEVPARGVVEVKGTGQELKAVVESEQVARYLGRYGQVLVTNYRDFTLVGRDEQGVRKPLESYSLARDEADFWSLPVKRITDAHAARFDDYLRRVLLHAAPLTAPKDVAWFLASYAREAKARLETLELPGLADVQKALEEALGLEFKGAKGQRFFRSTLVQTLFYGVFSAWVLWSRQHTPDDAARFDWRTAAHLLSLPVLRKLYHQVADPGQLQSLHLVETLDWAAAALNRVDRETFFATFEETQAVQYFYEPFLEAFDPELRKELGVWYTPHEIVQYMVARVDTVLREELGVQDGLADPAVLVLDPCCGTGTFLVEVLKRIAATLRARGENGLLASDVKQAAMQRVFGFEILPAPFVIAHLQVGLLLRSLGTPLDGEGTERASVYLTNALTGWQPGDQPHQLHLSPEFEAEHQAADRVKQVERILVVLGNPPYNAFAGVSPVEEQGMVAVYKEGLISEWGIKKFNLDDLYVRFFRLAEHKIAELTGKGVVCYISNFSYLSDPSFVVMRKRFLEEFDALWFDCLNGDSRETGKLTPEGKPDPSVFSTPRNREGIRVGTAIGLMARKPEREKKPVVRFRQFWGVSKRADLVASLATKRFNRAFELVTPRRESRFSLRPSRESSQYLSWPTLSALMAGNLYQGLDEDRALDLIDIKRERLDSRIRAFFDSTLDFDAVKSVCRGLTRDSARYDARAARKRLLSTDKYEPDRIVRYGFRPLDVRWCYYTSVRPIWKEPRPELWRQLQSGQLMLVSRPSAVATPEGVPFLVTRCLFARDSMCGHAVAFPVFLSRDRAEQQAVKQLGLPDRERPAPAWSTNLSSTARAYLESLGLSEPRVDVDIADLVWMHALAIGYSPAYLAENADGVRQNWPRIPLPNAKKCLLTSAALGRQVAALLDTESPVVGVTAGTPRAELQSIAVISHVAGKALNPDAGDLELRAGWGHTGKGGIATMPGKGKLVERPYTAAERSAIEEGAKALGLSAKQALQRLGPTTCDVYLNDVALWRNVPRRVWEYTIGGYQVMKKWLSYREAKLLGRSLTQDEAREVTHMARRIAAIVLLEPALDENYARVKRNVWEWKAG